MRVIRIVIDAVGTVFKVLEEKRLEEMEMKNGDPIDHRIVKINANLKKGPEDLRRFAVT